MLIMASHLPNPIWYVFGSLVTIGGIYALIFYLKKKTPIKKPNPNQSCLR